MSGQVIGSSCSEERGEGRGQMASRRLPLTASPKITPKPRIEGLDMEKASLPKTHGVPFTDNVVQIEVPPNQGHLKCCH